MISGSDKKPRIMYVSPENIKVESIEEDTENVEIRDHHGMMLMRR